MSSGYRPNGYVAGRQRLRSSRTKTVTQSNKSAAETAPQGAVKAARQRSATETSRTEGTDAR
jgi:hypothetical protein